MDMRLPPGVNAAKPAVEAPPPLRLLQRWQPPAPVRQPSPPPSAWHAAWVPLRRLIFAR